MKTAFFEGNQKKICPARNELVFTVLRLHGFPSTDFSGFSFLHAKVGRERLVYFIVSYHIVN